MSRKKKKKIICYSVTESMKLTERFNIDFTFNSRYLEDT